MEFTTGNPVQLILEFFGALALIASGIKAILYFLAPYRETKQKIEEHEQRLNEHDKYFKNDKERLDVLADLTKESLKLQLSMADHAIDGNGIDGMKKVRKEIQDKIFDVKGDQIT